MQDERRAVARARTRERRHAIAVRGLRADAGLDLRLGQRARTICPGAAAHRMRGVADDRYEYQCLPEGHRAETVEIGAAGYSIANVGTSQASEEAATNTAYTPQLHHLTLTVRIRKSPHGITES